MCGRFTLAFDGDGLLRSYVAASRDRAAQWEPTYSIAPRTKAPVVREFIDGGQVHRCLELARWGLHPGWAKDKGPRPIRSEEHTSELQSRGQLVCRLLLEKKKLPNIIIDRIYGTANGDQVYGDVHILSIYESRVYIARVEQQQHHGSSLDCMFNRKSISD